MKILERGAIINAAEVGDLQAALNQLPPTGGAVYLPAGKYEVDCPIVFALKERQHLHLYGDGRATVIHYTPEDGSHFFELRGVENSWWPDLRLTIRDLSLIGNHKCGDALHLLWPNDGLVDTCFFYGFGGTAVWVGPNATNVTVRDCWMRDCRRALCAEDLHHLTFHGNQTRSVDKIGLHQAEHVYIGRHCREVRIVNNHLAYGHSEGIILDGTAQHVVANNTIEGFTVGIRAVDCRDITLAANYLHTPTGILMEGENRGLTVTGNLFTNNPGGAVCIRTSHGSGGHVISSNIIRQSVYGDGQRGVDLGDAVDCVVNGNVFEDLTGDPAVAARDLGLHTVAQNSVGDCAIRARAGAQGLRVPAIEDDNPYRALCEHLKALPAATARVTFGFWDLHRILGRPLPDAAAKRSEWWDNDVRNPQARAWLAAGWLVIMAHRIENRVVLARQN